MPTSPPKSPTLETGQALPLLDDIAADPYELNQGSFEPLHLPNTMASSMKILQHHSNNSYMWEMQSRNDYLQQWLPKQESYLHHLLDQEAPPEGRRCSICDQDGVYKCQDCLGEPLYCTGCCRSQHQCNPFHWISQWNGQFFEQSSLAHIGLVIHLGHNGKQCLVFMDMLDVFKEDESNEPIEPEDIPSVSGPEFQPKENTTVIVDKSRVHRLEVRCCGCPDAMSLDIQLFQHGLFPTSFNKPKTVFTFNILDDFVLDNLECSTSAMNYYNKLRRMTSSAFPYLIPDRYQELMRVSRQWRKLKSMKWHGFGHIANQPKLGDLALFCPACPQPGINISLAREESLDEWKYTRSFAMDGNFKVEHLHPINPDDAMNMDYALCEAAAYNMKGISKAVNFYDINCQYQKHFCTWVDRGQFLTMDPKLTIMPRIGLWHVHGHQDSCYVRYASNFIEGIGHIDGEIMETLWAPLNLISLSTRGMSSPHRKECLDFQMNDSNFCKMICMKRSLCRKYKEAKRGVTESQQAFDRLDGTAPEGSKILWLASKRAAQSNRIRDPAMMDIYEINIWKAPSKKEIELRLLQENDACHALPSHQSVATWISMGLAMEEAQIALLIEVRRLGKRLTETQKLHIARQWDRLQGQINAFTWSAHSHLRDEFNGDDDHWDLDPEILDNLNNDPEDFAKTFDICQNTPELTVIPLPSNFGMSLHEGQANDALHNLRIHLWNKAVLFRTSVRQVKSQALKTRAWSQVTLVEQAMSLNASIYKKTRKQMVKLGPGQLQLLKYQPLLQEQLKVSAAVGDPNARGQRNESLAWFWSLNIDLS
ncbi:uncharacterized protein EDB91DRAFT_1256508 [Suillus paluster]|uniref:uncharacterized protein n=1 Tax=Suillus paluster TaxID=48578 RepID=UPI001B8716BE|nr:uncharacterized protein EDB91DRAFT_1256508 [Suillus paluster]KAG1721480.1 hypothetical protein EDB91DRAFT_1256508 [Suillus paluster]